MLVARVGGWAGVAARMRIGAVAARNPGSGILLAEGHALSIETSLLGSNTLVRKNSSQKNHSNK